MSYLDKKPDWNKVKNSAGKSNPRKTTFLKGTKGAIFLSILLLVSLSSIGLYVNSEGVYFNSYKGTHGVAWASPPGKALDFMITKMRNFFAEQINSVFPLDRAVSIVPEGEGEKIGTKLDPVAFTLLNIEKEYLNSPAADTLYPSLMLANGKKMTEVLGAENLSMGFQVIAYRNFQRVSKYVQGSPSHMNEPFLEIDGKMQGLHLGFERRFADGIIRQIKPNDTWALFRPNTHGMWRRSQIDKDLGAISLEPEETLPVLFWLMTNLCDQKTGEWDIKRTQWLVSRQYPIAYGVYADPEEIEIIGKGLQTRFVYTGKLPVDRVIVRWAREQKDPNWEPSNKDIIVDVDVPILTRNRELCFWGSHEADQSVVIPFSYLKKMDTKKTPFLLGNRKAGELIPITLQDILDELQQVRENRAGRSIYVYAKAGDGQSHPSSFDYSAHVTRTDRLTDIADKAIGKAKTPEEAVANLMAFTNLNLPYSSDWMADKNAPGYNGPMQRTMSPLVALLNRGKDCDGIATHLAGLWFSAKHEKLKGLNETVALMTLDYVGIGHLVPLLPNVWENLTTNPFPNHILLPYGGKNVPYAIVEPTGQGYNKMHQTQPTKRAYEPRFATLIKGAGPTREVGAIGFNQFQYLQSVQ